MDGRSPRLAAPDSLVQDVEGAANVAYRQLVYRFLRKKKPVPSYGDFRR